MGCGQIHGDHGCVSSSYKSCKALLGVGLVCLLLLVLGVVDEHDGVIDGHVMIRSAAVLAARRYMVVKRLKVLVEEEQKNDMEQGRDHMSQYRAAASGAASGKDIVDINYMSKRRVPNGADPIHNRRAGKSRRPPSET